MQQTRTGGAVATQRVVVRRSMAWRPGEYGAAAACALPLRG